MDKNDLAKLTVYSDLMTILKEKGMLDAECAEILLKVTSQVDIEVTEEIIKRLSDDQLKILDNLPDDAPSEEIAEKVGLKSEEVEEIKEQKIAEVIQEMIPTIDQED